MGEQEGSLGVGGADSSPPDHVSRVIARKMRTTGLSKRCKRFDLMRSSSSRRWISRARVQYLMCSRGSECPNGSFLSSDLHATTRQALISPMNARPRQHPTTLDYRLRVPTRIPLLCASAAATMPSYEAKLLTDFLIAPASLRDFMTLRQFTDIFPKGHRSNPAIKELYRELYTLRERDIEAVRQDIADEVKRSKRLKREYARERRQMDDANVAGLNPIALQMEEEVRHYLSTSLAFPSLTIVTAL